MEEKKEVTIQEIQSKLLEILLYFQKFCQENGLGFVLAGGTCLGAVRHKGFIPWDDDVDDSVRAKIEELTGEELVDEDYDSAVDGVILWWRDGDDEDELSDTIVDAYAVLGNDGPLWVLTPKPGRPGAASSSTVQSAAQTAGMNAATPLTVSPDWNGIRLRAFGKGR